MGKICCAVRGCDNRSASRHRFPNPKKYFERFAKWVLLCDNKEMKSMLPEKVYNIKRVCGLHFVEKDFLNHSRLNCDACPKLLLPSERAHGDELSDSLFKSLSTDKIDIDVSPNGDCTIVENLPEELYQSPIEFVDWPRGSSMAKITSINNNHDGTTLVGKSQSKQIKEVNLHSMLKMCCVSNCKDKFGKLHRFPIHDKQRCLTWINFAKNAKLENLSPEEIYEKYYICNAHFNSSCLVPGTRSWLKVGAIPTIFSVPAKDTNANTEIIEIEDDEPPVNGIENNKKISVDDFSQVCRSCLSKDNVLESIFSLNYEGLGFDKIFEMCTTVKIRKGDELPEKICMECINEMVRFHDFAVRCQKSDETFKRALKEKNVGVDEKPHQILDSISNEEENKQPLLTVVLDDSDENTEEPIVKPPDEPPNSKQFATRLPQEYEFRGYRIPSTCSTCQVRFRSFKELNVHCKESGHPVPKNYVCEVCGNAYSSMRALGIHNKVVHKKERPFSCKECGATYRSRTSVSRHKQIHTGFVRYICELCGQGFRDSDYLLKHTKRKHTKERPFKCSYCEKSFFTSGTRAFHERRHETQKERPDRLICNRCQKSFGTAESLENHKKSRHSGIRRFLCNECGKCFTTNTILLSHMLIHSGARPISCKLCKKSFRSRSSLNAHERIHKGIKSHVCHVCGKAFIQSSHLKRHVRVIHDRLKPFSCTMCEKTFSVKGNLLSHIRTHTGESQYVCEFCEKGFYHKTNLTKHRKIHLRDIEVKIEETVEVTAEEANVEFEDVC